MHALWLVTKKSYATLHTMEKEEQGNQKEIAS